MSLLLLPQRSQATAGQTNEWSSKNSKLNFNHFMKLTFHRECRIFFSYNASSTVNESHLLVKSFILLLFMFVFSSTKRYLNFFFSLILLF